LADDFKYYSPFSDGSLEEVNIRPSNTYYRGNFENDEESLIILTVTNNENAYGFARYTEGSFAIKLEEDRKRSGEPMLAIVPGEVKGAVPPQWCGSDHDHVAPGAQIIEASNGTEHSHESRRAVLNVIRVAVECDSTYWTYFGSYQPSLDYVTDIMATVSGIYSRDVSASISFSTFICSATAYSYGTTDNNAALLAVSSRWRANYSGITRDIVALLLGANVGGLAYISAACDTTYGYSVNGITKWLPGDLFDYILVNFIEFTNFLIYK